jgi:ribosomal protein L37AE/L43A
MSKTFKPTCKLCGEEFASARFKLGIALCLDCGDELAHERKFTVVPMNKSNYMLVTDHDILKQLNPKRTT